MAKLATRLIRTAAWQLVGLAWLSSEADAQRLRLELRPRVGDTVSMRLDQVARLSGSRGPARSGKTGRGSTPSASGSAGGSSSVVTTLRMFSRAIVQESEPGSAVILAITDSIDVYTSDEHARTLIREAERQLEGRSVRLRLAPDGTVMLADQPTDVPVEVSELVSVMPASFPKYAIAVGDTWMREMPIPPGSRLGMPVSGVVRARFRLDSVSRDQDVAHVSMRGSLEPASGLSMDSSSLSGSVSGSMVVDRRRGWLSESRFFIEMWSVVARVGDTGPPMEFRVRITQYMRVSDQRR